MKQVAISILIASLLGCFKFEPAKEAVISPGDDPLVNLIYQDLLASNAIKYKLDPQGYYVSALENRETMHKLAEDAHKQANVTTELELRNKCVAEEVSNRLTGAIYVIHENNKGIFLKTLPSTYDKHEIMAKIVVAESECRVNV